MQGTRSAIPEYLAIDGALYAARILSKNDRSMVADIYRNDADYHADDAIERSVVLDYSSPAQ